MLYGVGKLLAGRHVLAIEAYPEIENLKPGLAYCPKDALDGLDKKRDD
jgi:hypothetical protein